MSDSHVPARLEEPDIPEDLIFRKFPFQPRSYPSRVALDKRHFNDDHQTFTIDLSLEPWAFVDNSDPAAPYLYVLLRIDTRFSPGTIVNPYKTPDGYAGLYQAMFSIDVTPRGRSVAEIGWRQSSPETVNQEVTKTSSASDTMSFKIGYKSGEASRSWTYSSGQSYTITEWNIVETGEGNKMGWRFWQRLPWDGMKGASEQDVTRLPGLSQYTAQVHAQGIWVTSAVPPEPYTFDIVMRQLPQMTWGGKTGLAIPYKDAAAPRIEDSFTLDFSELHAARSA